MSPYETARGQEALKKAGFDGIWDDVIGQTSLPGIALRERCLRKWLLERHIAIESTFLRGTENHFVYRRPGTGVWVLCDIASNQDEELTSKPVWIVETILGKPPTKPIPHVFDDYPTAQIEATLATPEEK